MNSEQLDLHESDHARGQCECPCIWAVEELIEDLEEAEQTIRALEKSLRYVLDWAPSLASPGYRIAERAAQIVLSKVKS